MWRGGGKAGEGGGHRRWAGIIAIVNNADFAVVIDATMALSTSVWRLAVDQRRRGFICWQTRRCNAGQHAHGVFGKVTAIHAQFKYMLSAGKAGLYGHARGMICNRNQPIGGFGLMAKADHLFGTSLNCGGVQCFIKRIVTIKNGNRQPLNCLKNFCFGRGDIGC